MHVQTYSMNQFRRNIVFDKLLRTLLILCIFACYPVHKVYSQIPDWEHFLERISTEEEGEYAAWSYLYDELCELHEHPFNLNTVTKEQLEQLPFLSPLQVENLLAYLYSYGPLKSLGELNLVEELDLETRQMLAFFVYLGDEEKETGKKTSLRNILQRGKHEMLTRLDIPLYKRAGFKEYSDSILNRYPNRKYAGDPYYHSLRYQFRYGNKVYAGLVAEKDAGEPFFAAGQKGYDFYSYYLLLKNIGRLKTLAVGNYRLHFGQGLVMNTDFSLGKSASLTSFHRLNKGIRKHSSTGEDNYLQGVAAAYRLGRVVATLFYSQKRQDANLSQDSTIQANLFITSFKTDGYHRTPLERSKKNNISNTLFGSNLTYKNKAFQLGFTAVYNVFNKLLIPDDEPYKKYYPSGKEFQAYSVDYSYYHPRFTVVGETAYSSGGGIATLNYFQYKLNEDYKLMLIQRYYSKRYDALYANAFGESSTVRNEQGVYVGIEAHPLRKVQVTGYVDAFRFPYLTYQASLPDSRGVDTQWQMVWTPRKQLSFLLRYRYKNKGKDFTLKNSRKWGVAPVELQKYRVQCSYSPNEQWLLKTTFDYVQEDFITQDSDVGYMVTQNISCRPHFAPLQLDVMLSYFDTDSYASRVYIYEKGMPYSFSFPSFYYRGVHGGLLLRADLNKQITLLGRYNYTHYFNRETIGSSQQLINGNSKQDIQLMLRMKW